MIGERFSRTDAGNRIRTTGRKIRKFINFESGLFTEELLFLEKFNLFTKGTVTESHPRMEFGN